MLYTKLQFIILCIFATYAGANTLRGHRKLEEISNTLNSEPTHYGDIDFFGKHKTMTEITERIQNSIANSLRIALEIIITSNTKNADNDGFVREGIVFCGVNYDQMIPPLLSSKPLFTDENISAFDKLWSPHFSSNTEMLGSDGWGGEDALKESRTICGTRNCEPGSIVHELAERINSEGYYVTHGDICEAYSEKPWNKLPIRTCQLNAYKGFYPYEMNDKNCEIFPAAPDLRSVVTMGVPELDKQSQWIDRKCKGDNGRSFSFKASASNNIKFYTQLYTPPVDTTAYVLFNIGALPETWYDAESDTMLLSNRACFDRLRSGYFSRHRTNGLYTTDPDSWLYFFGRNSSNLDELETHCKKQVQRISTYTSSEQHRQLMSTDSQIKHRVLSAKPQINWREFEYREFLRTRDPEYDPINVVQSDTVELTSLPNAAVSEKNYIEFGISFSKLDRKDEVVYDGDPWKEHWRVESGCRITENGKCFQSEDSPSDCVIFSKRALTMESVSTDTSGLYDGSYHIFEEGHIAKTCEMAMNIGDLQPIKYCGALYGERTDDFGQIITNWTSIPDRVYLPSNNTKITINAQNSFKFCVSDTPAARVSVTSPNGLILTIEQGENTLLGNAFTEATYVRMPSTFNRRFVFYNTLTSERMYLYYKPVERINSKEMYGGWVFDDNSSFEDGVVLISKGSKVVDTMTGLLRNNEQNNILEQKRFCRVFKDYESCEKERTPSTTNPHLYEDEDFEGVWREYEKYQSTRFVGITFPPHPCEWTGSTCTSSYNWLWFNYIDRNEEITHTIERDRTTQYQRTRKNELESIDSLKIIFGDSESYDTCNGPQTGSSDTPKFIPDAKACGSAAIKYMESLFTPGDFLTLGLTISNHSITVSSGMFPRGCHIRLDGVAQFNEDTSDVYCNSGVKLCICAGDFEFYPVIDAVAANEIRREVTYQSNFGGTLTDRTNVMGVEAANTWNTSWNSQEKHIPNNCKSLRQYVAAINGNTQINAFNDASIVEAENIWRSLLKNTEENYNIIQNIVNDYYDQSTKIFPLVEDEDVGNCAVGKTEFEVGDSGSEAAPSCVPNNMGPIEHYYSPIKERILTRKRCFCRSGGSYNVNGRNMGKELSQHDEIYLIFNETQLKSFCENWGNDKPIDIISYCNGDMADTVEWAKHLKGLEPQEQKIKVFSNNRANIYTKLKNTLKLVESNYEPSCGRLISTNKDFPTSNKGANCLPFQVLHELLVRMEVAPEDSSNIWIPYKTENNFMKLLNQPLVKYENYMLAYEIPFQLLEKDSFRYQYYEKVYMNAGHNPLIPKNVILDEFDALETTDYDQLNEAIFNLNFIKGMKSKIKQDNGVLWQAFREELVNTEKDGINWKIALNIAKNIMRVTTTDENDNNVDYVNLLGAPKSLFYPTCGNQVTEVTRLIKFHNKTGRCDPCASGTYATRDSANCKICYKGSITNTGKKPGATTCIQCEHGKYSNESTLSQCTSCGPGKISELGASTCTTCLVGQYSSEGNSVCSDCPSGKFSSTAEDTCTECPMGKNSEVGSSTCVCQAGKFMENDSCETCAEGTYAATGANSCTSCVQGYADLDINSETPCEECPAGTYSSGATTACTSCTTGTYSIAGQSSCDFIQSNCPDGTYAENQACKICLAGKMSTEGATSCTNCIPGKFSDDSSAACIICPNGRISTEAESSCTECSAGKIATYVSESDLQKPIYDKSITVIGRYMEKFDNQGVQIVGSNKCVACRVGTSTPRGIDADNYGLFDNCIRCESGKYRASLSDPATSYFGTLTFGLNVISEAEAENLDLSCQKCPSGWFMRPVVDTRSTCTPCNAGKTSEEGASSCKSCPVGKTSYHTDGQTSKCTSLGSYCPTFTSWKSKNGACETYTPGHYSGNHAYCKDDFGIGDFHNINADEACSTCGPCGETCQPGTYRKTKAEGGGIECVNCPVGYMSPFTGSRECRKCAQGQHTPSERAATCVFCSPGKVFQDNACINCPVGRYLSGFSSETTCKGCSPGKYSDEEGSVWCKDCETGSYSTVGQTSCDFLETNCPAGTHVDNQGCVTCPAGKFSTEGLSSCTVCPVGKTSNEGRNLCNIACTLGSSNCCQSGEYRSENTNTCQPCESGTFSTLYESNTCQICLAGTYSLSKFIECKDCKVGKISSDGASLCNDCPNGKSSITGSTTCTDNVDQLCPGIISWESIWGTCETYAFGERNHEKCSVDTDEITRITAEVACPECFNCNIRCPTGRFISSETTSIATCTDCLPGTYSDSEASNLCTSCPSGFSSAARSNTCEFCRNGVEISNTGFYQCISLWNNIPGVCPSSHKYENTITNECVAICPIGTSINTPWDTCVRCKAGLYQDQEGQPTCKLCTKGKTTSFEDFRIPLNERIPAVSASECVGCSAGKYAAYSSPYGITSWDGIRNDFSCDSCPFGFTSSALAIGQKDCFACGDGTYTELGTGGCTNCPTGWYMLPRTPDIFDTTCKYCKSGRYSLEGSTTCTDCPTGFYSAGMAGSYWVDPVLQAQYSGTPNFYMPTCESCIDKYPPGIDVHESFKYPQSGVQYPNDMGYVGWVSNAGSAMCTLCPAGKFSSNGVCTDCPVGTYTDSNGQFQDISRCKSCGQLKTSTVPPSDVCMCAQGSIPKWTWQGDLPGKVLTPPPESITENGYTAYFIKFFEVPKINYYLWIGYNGMAGGTPSTDMKCEQCPAGTYAKKFTFDSNFSSTGKYDLELATTCYNCPVGTTSLAGSATCGCVAGQYETQNGACDNCNPGLFSIVGQTSCSDCPAGMYGHNASGACLNCPVDQLSQHGDNICTDCPTGKTAPNEGSTTCSCGPQTYVNGNDCIDCPTGQTTRYDTINAQSCTNCSVGKFRYFGSCRECDDGQYAEEGSDTCTLCPAGTYVTQVPPYGPTSDVCNTCPTGYVSGTGADSCKNACSDGEYLDNKACILCPADTIATSGDTTCTPCSNGQVAPPGSVSCFEPDPYLCPGVYEYSLFGIYTCETFPSTAYCDYKPSGIPLSASEACCDGICSQ